MLENLNRNRFIIFLLAHSYRLFCTLLVSPAVGLHCAYCLHAHELLTNANVGVTCFLSLCYVIVLFCTLKECGSLAFCLSLSLLLLVCVCSCLVQSSRTVLGHELERQREGKWERERAGEREWWVCGWERNESVLVFFILLFFLFASTNFAAQNTNAHTFIPRTDSNNFERASIIKML